MKNTKEKIATWILDEWAKNYFRFNDIQADFKVLSFEQTENVLSVKCSFVSDESKNSSELDSLVMFRYDPENYDGFFPSQVQIITLEVKYTWVDNESCDSLASGYSEEISSHDVDYVNWNDPKINDEVVKILLNGTDQYAVAETLINLHDAKVKMPDFVPDRLKSYFSKIITAF